MGDRKALEERLAQIVGKVRNLDNFFIVGNYDCDGITATAILMKALQRENKKVLGTKILKQLYTEIVLELKELQKKLGFENIIFADLGSSYLKELEQAFGDHFFVFDHHQVTTDCENHFNVNLFDFSGSYELSASGTAYFFARMLNEKNKDLADLGIVGACGDVQDSSGKVIGLNREILEDGITAGVLEKKTDLRLYGRISRPLVQFLMFASSPVLPGLTGNEGACVSFLIEHGIKIKENDHWPSYEELSLEHKQKFTTALIVYLHQKNIPEWKIQSLIGEVYTLTRENLGSPLKDAKEYGTILNACGRWEKEDIALQVCLGNRSNAYEEALKLLANHRKELSEGIKLIQEQGVQEKKNYYYFDSEGKIKDSIIGIVAGMLYGSGTLEHNKPIIAVSKYPDGSLKISARASDDLTRAGLHLGKALKNCCAQIQGAEGGGHCVSKDTSIILENGLIKKISELGGQNKIAGFNFSKKEITHGSIHEKFTKKVKTIYSIKTRPFEISCSAKHRFFILNKSLEIKEKRAGQLRKGDFVLGTAQIKVKSTETVNPLWAEILGYYVRDGGLNQNKCLEFKDADLQLINQYKKIGKTVWGLDGKVKPVSKKNCHKLRFYSRKLVEQLKKECPEIFFSSKEKRIPEKILKSSNNALSGFLKGVLDADGSIEHHEVTFYSISAELIKDIQLSLLRFGIISCMRRKKIVKFNDVYRLGISDWESIKKFKEKIGSNSKAKARKLKNLLKNAVVKEKRTYTRSYPILLNQLYHLGRSLNISPDKLNGLARGSDRKIIEKNILDRFKLNVKKHLKKITQLKIHNLEQKRILTDGGLLLDQLENLSNENILWCKIKKIKKIKKTETMYDLNIPKLENYVANGLIVHNSPAAGCRIPADQQEKFLKLLEEEIEKQLEKK